VIAKNRPLMSKLTRWSFVKSLSIPIYTNVSGLVLRALGAVYIVAFSSLLFQYKGLFGQKGILPAQLTITQAHNVLGAWAPLKLPSIFLINASDTSLGIVLALGAISGLAMVFNRLPKLTTFITWFMYLSIHTIGQDFLSFQWDTLLLEMGLICWIMTWVPTQKHRHVGIFLLKILLFRLMFSSGLVKILSGDLTWRNLTALDYHFYTQPLPNLISWYAHQIPSQLLRIACFVMFIIELIIPFFIWGPRRFRLIAFWAMSGLQIILILTGNFAFFNWLTLVLTLCLIDDIMLPKWTLRFTQYTQKVSLPSINQNKVSSWWCRIGIFLAVMVASQQFAPNAIISKSTRPVRNILLPFRVANPYGLFAMMTTHRPELIIEGSDDGTNWYAYSLPWKPQNPKTPPKRVAPYHPRLDWQLWFAGLGTYRNNPWTVNLMIQLLRNSKDVTALFSFNPFPLSPPKYVRIMKSNYEFTTFEERERSNFWWKILSREIYLPALTLKQ
jgi:lipase maturation factor 1